MAGKTGRRYSEAELSSDFANVAEEGTSVVSHGEEQQPKDAAELLTMMVNDDDAILHTVTHFNSTLNVLIKIVPNCRCRHVRLMNAAGLWIAMLYVQV
jgi:hypothetical protein